MDNIRERRRHFHGTIQIVAAAHPLAVSTVMQDDHSSVFSGQDFVASWCRAFNNKPFEVEVSRSGPTRKMYWVKIARRYGLYHITHPKPDDLWASPGWTGTLSQSTVKNVLEQLKSARTLSIHWQVRFDHKPLADALIELGLRFHRVQIHVLDLDRGYKELFDRYNASTRNHVRKAIRRGVSVRDAHQYEDILAYQAIYSRHAFSQGWGFEYPGEMTHDLARLPGIACFKVAEHEGRVIGGALFIRDGNSVYYLHGVADREFTSLYPASVLIDSGIKWACDVGASFFNLGNSGVSPILESLATFKSSWGAHPEQNWQFVWHNPIWKALEKHKIKLLGERRRPQSLPNRQEREVNSVPWSERARFDELRAVCELGGTAKKNIVMHGATLFAGAKALGLGRRFNLRPRILDFGCGTGRMIRFFSKHNCQTVGVDVTFQMLEAAKRHGLPNNSILAHFDGVNIPLKDNSIDIVWACGVLKYTLFPPGSRCLHGTDPATLPDGRFNPTCHEVAREMYRVLAPNGIVAHCEVWINESPEVFKDSFESAGFVAEKVGLVRRDGDYIERLFRTRWGSFLPALLTSRMAASLCYWFGDPVKAGFRDYLIVWRKHSSLSESKAGNA
jgi:SAM-dependent methyltransferase